MEFSEKAISTAKINQKLFLIIGLIFILFSYPIGKLTYNYLLQDLEKQILAAQESNNEILTTKLTEVELKTKVENFNKFVQSTMETRAQMLKLFVALLCIVVGIFSLIMSFINKQFISKLQNK